MRFRVTLDRKRRGVSRHYDVIVEAASPREAWEKAVRRRRGMTVFRVVSEESKGDG